MGEQSFEELARRDAFLSRLVDSLSAGLAYFDRDLVYRYVNETYARVTLGRPVADYLDRPIAAVLPDAQGETEARLRGVMATGEPWRHRAWPVTLERDGRTEQTFWEFEAYPLRGDDGEAMGVVVWSVESTARILLEREAAAGAAALEEARAKLQGVLDSATSGVMVMDAVRDEAGEVVDFVFTLVNPKSEAMVGLKAEDLLGRRLLSLFPGNRASGQFAMYVAVMATGEPGQLETHYHDGRLDFWLDVSAVKVDEGVAVTFTDVTARKRTEQDLETRSVQLASQKAFAERVIENVTTGICYFDRDLVFRLVNETYCRLLQRPREEILGRHAYDVVPGSEAATLPLFRDVLDRGEAHGFKAVPFTMRTPAGAEQVTYGDAMYLPMKAVGADEVEGILVLCDEVSDRLENERLHLEHIQVLEAANRHKEQFLSIVSHELRTPINAIMGFTSVLNDDVLGRLTPGQHAYLERILDGSERMLALINDLLDMSRLQAGRFPIHLEEVDLAGLCAAAVTAIEPLATAKGVDLASAAPAGLPPVQADAQRIGQVLTNLLGNAIKFTPGGGRVRVTARVEGPDLRVEVRDTGLGIPRADQARVFEPFTQVDMSYTREAGGSGLGLAISKSLVEAHGGRIGVDSVEGAGSTFWFTLPLRRPSP